MGLAFPLWGTTPHSASTVHCGVIYLLITLLCEQPVQNEVLDSLTKYIVWALGILLLAHLASRACASFTSPSPPRPIAAQGSVMQTTFCQIKFEWIGGMTTIPSEWICKGLSSFLAHVPASRSSHKTECLYSCCSTSLPLQSKELISPQYISYIMWLDTSSQDLADLTLI